MIRRHQAAEMPTSFLYVCGCGKCVGIQRACCEQGLQRSCRGFAKVLQNGSQSTRTATPAERWMPCNIADNVAVDLGEVKRKKSHMGLVCQEILAVAHRVVVGIAIKHAAPCVLQESPHL